MGKHFSPHNAVVEVACLTDTQAKVEIEAIIRDASPRFGCASAVIFKPRTH
jgi:hypothetical protein